jgi:type I restriction enzyme S subunit
LSFARPGNIVVAKIDLKNGAVGIVPDWPNVVVTNHFAVYSPDCSRLVPEYLIEAWS